MSKRLFEPGYPYILEPPITRIVGICEWHGTVILATERGVYRLDGEKFVQMELVHLPTQEASS